jgi:hypothetical protein
MQILAAKLEEMGKRERERERERGVGEIWHSGFALRKDMK